MGGTEPAKVLVGVTGPTLLTYRIDAALTDPVFELHDANGSVITNDDWRETQEAESVATTLQPGTITNRRASPHAPGSYTAVVRGKNNTTGVAVVEAYTLK